MVHQISQGLITVHRGDTFNLPLSLNVGTPLNISNFGMQQGDVARLRLFVANEPWEDYVLSKDATIENVTIENEIEYVTFSFNERDTQHIIAGEYYYELKVLSTRDNVDYITTVIPRRKFVITN